MKKVLLFLMLGVFAVGFTACDFNSEKSKKLEADIVALQKIAAEKAPIVKEGYTMIADLQARLKAGTITQAYFAQEAPKYYKLVVDAKADLTEVAAQMKVIQESAGGLSGIEVAGAVAGSILTIALTAFPKVRALVLVGREALGAVDVLVKAVGEPGDISETKKSIACANNPTIEKAVRKYKNKV